MLYAGRIVETGTVAAVFAQPLHPYTRGLLRSLPQIVTQGEPGELAPIPGQVPNPLAMPAGCAFSPRCPIALPACSAIVPPLVDVAPARASACIRWRELAA